MDSQSSFWAKIKTAEREKGKWKISLAAIRGEKWQDPQLNTFKSCSHQHQVFYQQMCTKAAVVPVRMSSRCAQAVSFYGHNAVKCWWQHFFGSKCCNQLNCLHACHLVHWVTKMLRKDGSVTHNGGGHSHKEKYCHKKMQKHFCCDFNERIELQAKDRLQVESPLW